MDFSTLKWVKSELDETLKQARQALEAFVEDPEDDSQLRFCSAHLHQVSGTLQMVELYGASMLAEEMEKLLLALQKGGIAQKDEALELLMRGILQLPDYLDRLIAGYQDIPLVLLPLLNDLRAVQGESLVSENALFSPNIDALLPQSALAETGDATLIELARGQRHAYQVALLGWFRGRDVAASLEQMETVLGRLQAASASAQARRLWWIARGLVQALRADRIEVSMATKLLLGQVDRQIKRVIDADEAALQQEPPVELLKNLLFYVARAQDAAGLAAEIQATYRLAELLPDEEQMEQARQSLSGHNMELMATVTAAIKEDLGRIKDALDVCLRSSERDPAALAPAAETLDRVGDTLGMLGMGALRKQIVEQAGMMHAMVDGERGIEDDQLMQTASAVLYVESSLDGLLHGDVRQADFADESRQIEAIVPESEFNQVRGVVADEAIRDIARAKDSILQYIETPDNFALLEPVPALFSQIKGSLLLLNENPAAELLAQLAEFVDEQMLGRQRRLSESELDLLADAISSIEYFLENLQERKVFSGSILDVARDSLNRLTGAEAAGSAVQADAGAPAQTAMPEGGPDSGETAIEAGDDEVIEIPALETEEPEETAAPSDAFEVIELESSEGPEVEAFDADLVDTDTLESIEIDLSEDASAAGAEAPATEAAPAPLAQELPYPVLEGGDVDDEILEIFIEEATEEVAAIRERLPRWLDDAGDQEAMNEIRRSFHTLKGSGRLVGAMLIGEFAWTFENMLNRLIDGTIERGDVMCRLLQAAADVLPELVAQIQGQEGLSRDVSAMMQAAEALARGETPEPAGFEAPVAAAPEPAAEPEPVEQEPVEAEAAPTAGAGVETEPAEPVIDPVLFEIFDNEAREHIGSIREYLDAAEASGDSSVTDALIRAVHTLHGSAHMAGAARVAAIAAEMERYTKALLQAGVQIPGSGRQCLARAVDMVETLIPLLQQGDADLPDSDELIQRLRALPREAEMLLEQGVPEATPGSSHPWSPEQEEEVPAAGADALEADEVIEIEAAGPAPEATAGPEPEIELDAGSPAEAEPEPAPAAGVEAEADQELIDIFLEEGDEILDNAEQVLQQWIRQPDDAELMAAMQRDLHTLKGGARMANLAPIGDLTHHLESLMIAAGDGQVAPSQELFDLMQLAQDRLVQMLEAVKAGQGLPAAGDLIPRIERIRKGEPPAPDPGAAPAPTEAPAAAAADDVEAVPIPPVEEIPRAQPERQERTQQELVRIRADLLDAMVNHAGEISIYRSRLEQQVGAFRFNLTELGQTVARMREQLRKMEIETEAQVLSRYEREYAEAAEQDEDFDPLEMDRYSTLQTLSRSMMESISDMGSLQTLLDNITRESETLLLQQSRVNTDLSEGLMRTRMVPFSGLAPRLRRIVRQVCQEVGKRAELEIEGAESEMDRTVIDRIIAPLEHMLRNAIAHGIETPERRLEQGKPETGSIRLTLRREGSEVVVRIADDGAGMDIEAIRAKARERGFITDDTDFTDNEIMQFVLETGFSTASEVTQVAGRGVGMDVVNSEVKQLGGSLHIDSAAGQGTSFTIRLPFTLAMRPGPAGAGARGDLRHPADRHRGHRAHAAGAAGSPLRRSREEVQLRRVIL
ncbi:Hpt domain-containing protein [Thiohalobacter thiocyanaticus]|nr:Hpt domain-containing protein [Thiohalobacter thiocyanaticus]